MRSRFSRYIAPFPLLLLAACAGSDAAPNAPLEAVADPAALRPGSSSGGSNPGALLAIDDEFRVTSLVVGESDAGVDLDGDGSVDNNAEAVFEVIQNSILASVEVALEQAEVPSQPDCLPGEPCADRILRRLEHRLNETFSVEAFSEAINGNIQSGEANYLLDFEGAGTALDLTWYAGEFQNTSWGVDYTLGVQPGALDAAGNGTFGPGDLSLRFFFERTDPQTGETDTLEIWMTFYDSRTVVSNYNATSLRNFVMGGAMSAEDLLELAEVVLETVNEEIPGAENDVDVDAILAQLESSIMPYADINIDSDADLEGFSIGFIGNADAIEIE